MDSNKEIKKVFELFIANKFEEAQELNNKILEVFPGHMYAKRYQKILEDKIKFDKLPSPIKGEGLGVRSKTVKIKWKSLKCPHCLAKIPFSGLNNEKKSEIKSGNYNNLEIKCPYCHTKFVLQKKKAQSILWIKIWDIANIEWKKYRATGYVEYSGYWYEDWYSDVTKYLEWILLWENNSYYYFSEWYSVDEWSSEQEFELSKKIIPNFRIPSNWTIFTKAIVKSIYWENSKNYVVWEKTILYEFTNSWTNYVKEIEWAWSQKEAGIYETRSISWNQANKIFWKENILKRNYNKHSSSWISFWGIIFWIIALLILPALIFEPIFNNFLENKEKIEISNLDEAKKVELKFKDFSVMQERKTSSTRYDYGGVKTYYSKNTGLKFSVKTDEDRKIIEKIKELEENLEIKKMFDWDLYKLK